MRRSRILALVAAMVASLAALTAPRAEAASLPDFPMALPVAWGATVQAGGPHTHVDGVKSSIDLGASGNVSVPVVAAADGIVTVKGTKSWSRCYVVLQHKDGWQTQYYHLKGIPTDLRDGQKVTAGQKLGMTGMPGSETCGRGTFRHVHFSLYRNGKEMPISGLSLGGYTVVGSGGAYCGYWQRDSDGTIVADARRACLAVPALVNNLVNPASLGTGAPEDSAASLEWTDARPVLADKDTISPAAALYVTEGHHTVNQRAWRTRCEPYSRTERCTTEIWATQVKDAGGGRFSVQEGWFWNNLTYKPMPRATWAKNPLGATGAWTASDGRKWRTECDTAATGRGGCRSYIWANVITQTVKPGGGQLFQYKQQWNFNSMVNFTPEAAKPDVRAFAASATAARPAATAAPAPSPSPSASASASPTASAVTTPTASPSPTASVPAQPSATPSPSGGGEPTS